MRSGGMEPGGGTLPRCEGGGTLPRAGGGTLRVDTAGGGWLRAPCDGGDGATGGDPDGGGMVGRKARRAITSDDNPKAEPRGKTFGKGCVFFGGRLAHCIIAVAP